jgi:hypothetical protein
VASAAQVGAAAICTIIAATVRAESGLSLTARVWSTCRRRVLGHSGLYQSRLRVVQLLEDIQRLLPGDSCGVRSAGDLLRIGKVGEDLRFQEDVPRASGQGEPEQVAFARLVVPAEMVLGEPDAVPGPGLRAWIRDAIRSAAARPARSSRRRVAATASSQIPACSCHRPRRCRKLSSAKVSCQV